MSPPRTATLGDSVAIGLSGLCLIHCLALPLAASLLPILGAWAEAEWVHWLFVAVAAPLSLWTLTRDRPLQWSLLAPAALGVTLLLAGAAGLPDHDFETPLTVAGGLLLAAAHTLNWRRRRRECRSPCA
jgi:hypothetical protein